MASTGGDLSEEGLLVVNRYKELRGIADGRRRPLSSSEEIILAELERLLGVAPPPHLIGRGPLRPATRRAA